MILRKQTKSGNIPLVDPSSTIWRRQQMVHLVYEEENSFLMPLVRSLCLEVWEQLSQLSKHRDPYRAVPFLIKAAQNTICLLSFPAGASPLHAEDRVSLPALVLTSIAEIPGHPRQEEPGPWCDAVSELSRTIPTQQVYNMNLLATHRCHIPLRQPSKYPKIDPSVSQSSKDSRVVIYLCDYYRRLLCSLVHRPARL